LAYQRLSIGGTTLQRLACKTPGKRMRQRIKVTPEQPQISIKWSSGMKKNAEFIAMS
jgi:hypothetical protein